MERARNNLMNPPHGGAPTIPQRALNEDDPLDDFEHRAITLDGATKVVHVAGAGPAVIVMAEMPGISPHVARFGRWVRDAGFTVYMPSLFGRDGAVASAEEGLAVYEQASISAEFCAFAAPCSCRSCARGSPRVVCPIQCPARFRLSPVHS